MDKNQILVKTVEMHLANAEKNLKQIRSSIQGSFELDYMIDSSTMERLAEYQAAVKMWRNLAKMVARGTEQGNLNERVEDKLQDMQENLFAQGAGGSTSQISNGVTEIDRKQMLRAYQTLSSLAKG